MNRITCEWCGHSYDLDKYESCPKCGGSISAETSEKLSKKRVIVVNNKGKKEKEGTNILVGIFAGIGIVLTFLLIIGLLSDDDEYIENNDSKYYNDYSYDDDYDDDYDDNYGDFTYADNGYVEERYYTDDFYIEHGDAKFYIPYVEYTDFNDGFMETLYLDVALEVYEPDYNEHSIDMYLLSGEKKYRLITNDYSFSPTFNTNVKHMNDILKLGKGVSFRADVEVGSDYKDGMFDTLLINIDKETYNIPLRYTSYVSSYDYFDKEIPLSEKISFGENYLYIDKIYLGNSVNSSYVSINIGTVLKDLIYDEIFIEAEDFEGNRYRLYEQDYFSYLDNISCLNDILKTEINNTTELSLIGFFNFNDIEKFIVTIDGEEHLIDI